MTILHVSRRVRLLKLVLLAFALCLSGWFSLAACGSEVITHTLESPSMAENMLGISSQRRFQVYLPDGYEEGSERYPLFYYIPGWTTGGSIYKSKFDDAIQSQRIKPIIIVHIDVTEGILFLNSPVFGNSEAFVISELIPFIDREYRTIPDSRARALIGHSMGGYSSLILPVRHPGIWGSIGGDDPAFWGMWYYLRNSGTALSCLQQLPKSIDGYSSWPFAPAVMMQLGAAFSPNPDASLLCDFPVTPQGQWIPEVKGKWEDYDLSNSDTLAEYSEILKNFLSIVVVVPESTSGTSRSDNITIISQWKAAGLDNVVRLDMPGGHGTYQPERLIAMAEVILDAMVGAEVSVSPRGKVAALWGEIKRGW